MGVASIYCPDDTKQGKTFGLPLNGEKRFFTFRMTHSGGESTVYDNNRKLQLDGIVTDLYLEKSESVSLASTLGSDMFLYVGGASPWIIQIGGYAFAPCKTDTHGFDTIIQWYNDENVSKTGGYCTLTLGTQVFKGYLTTCQIASADKEALNLFRFKFKFIAVRIQ